VEPKQRKQTQMRNCKYRIYNNSKKKLFEENYDAYEDAVKARKAVKGEPQPSDNNIEAEDTHHIFAPISKSNQIKKLKEKEKAATQEKTSLIKSALGKKLENFLNDKTRKSQLYNRHFEENYYLFDINSKYDIPILNKRQLDKSSFKLKVYYTPETFEDLERCFCKLRGEKYKVKETKQVSLPAVIEKTNIEDDSDDDIFTTTTKKVDNNTANSQPIKFIDDQDDDTFKYKNMNLSDLLKPYDKKKK
jgi:hypothetical protein